MNPSLVYNSTRYVYPQSDHQTFPESYFIMLTGCDTYPLKPYGIVRFDEAKFKSYDVETYSLVKKFTDSGYEVFTTGLNEFENQTTARLFRSGLVSHHKVGKEYPKIEEVSVPDTYVWYYAYRMKDFQYGDYIYFSTGSLFYLVWFGDDPSDESKTYPVSPESWFEHYFVYWDKNDFEGSLERLRKVFIEHLDCYANYDSINNCLIIGKNSGIPDSDNSTIEKVDLPYVVYDIECGLNSGGEVLDFESKVNTRLENIQITIDKVKEGSYNLSLRCYDEYDEETDSWDGDVYYSEFYDNMTSEELEYVLNKNSKLVSMKVYDYEFNITGEYWLKRISDIPYTTPPPIQERFEEIGEINDVSCIPDIVVESVPDYQKPIYEFFKDYSIFLFQNTILEGERIFNFVDSIRNSGEDYSYPSCLKAAQIIHNGSFEGFLDDDERIVFTESPLVHANELIEYRHGDYFNPFENTEGDRMYRLFVMMRVQNVLIKNLSGKNEANKMKSFLKNYKGELSNIGGSNCELSFSDFEFDYQKRIAKLEVEFKFYDTRIETYIIDVVINIT